MHDSTFPVSRFDTEALLGAFCPRDSFSARKLLTSFPTEILESLFSWREGGELLPDFHLVQYFFYFSEKKSTLFIDHAKPADWMKQFSEKYMWAHLKRLPFSCWHDYSNLDIPSVRGIAKKRTNNLPFFSSLTFLLGQHAGQIILAVWISVRARLFDFGGELFSLRWSRLAQKKALWLSKKVVRPGMIFNSSPRFHSWDATFFIQLPLLWLEQKVFKKVYGNNSLSEYEEWSRSLSSRIVNELLKWGLIGH